MKKDITIAFIFLFTITLFAQENGVINNQNSNFSRLKSINIGDCQWTDGFWADKFKVAEEVSVQLLASVTVTL